MRRHLSTIPEPPTTAMSVNDHVRITAIIEFVDGVTALHHFFEDGHTDRCEKMVEDLALELGMPMGEIVLLKYAAKLHDIGKLGISEHTLSRLRLSKSEMDMIKGHPNNGADIIKALGFDPRIEDAVRYHHEQWDGKGYPDKLKGEDIPYFARTICVVDGYDGTVNKRVYHPARTISAALEIMDAEAGVKYDPDIYAAFRKVIKNE